MVLLSLCLLSRWQQIIRIHYEFISLNYTKNYFKGFSSEFLVLKYAHNISAQRNVNIQIDLILIKAYYCGLGGLCSRSILWRPRRPRLAATFFLLLKLLPKSLPLLPSLKKSRHLGIFEKISFTGKKPTSDDLSIWILIRDVSNLIPKLRWRKCLDTQTHFVMFL